MLCLHACTNTNRILTATEPTIKLAVVRLDVFGFEQLLQVSVAGIPCKQEEQAAEATSRYYAFDVDLYRTYKI